MSDFLTFKSFISIEVLIIVYYIGAVVFPVGVFWGMKKYELFSKLYSKKRELFFLMIILFILMEIFWRVFMEFLIGYMQMRDALVIH